MASGYAQNTNITVIRGDTLDWGMLTSNNASSNITALRNGAVINLTGVNGIKLTAKYSYDDADVAAVFSKTIGAGITVVVAANGTFTATVAASDTASLPPVQLDLVYNIQVTDASNVVTTIMSGILTVLPDVTIATP
jgi:hypothetical protein